jgi:hypothetical protein
MLSKKNPKVQDNTLTNNLQGTHLRTKDKSTEKTNLILAKLSSRNLWLIQNKDMIL